MSKSQTKDTESKDKVFVWNDEEAKSLLIICQDYHKQNGVDTHFNWVEIAERFGKEHGKKICKEIAKNKFDYMKKNWKLWSDLRYKETGVGWNAEEGRITADDEWWDRKIKEKSQYRRFRVKPPDPELSDLWDSVYGTICATGQHCVSATMDVPVLETQQWEGGSSHKSFEDLLDMDDDLDEAELLRDLTGTQPTKQPECGSETSQPYDSRRPTQDSVSKQSTATGTRQRNAKRKKPSSGAAYFEEHMANVDRTSQRFLTLLEGELNGNGVQGSNKVYYLDDAIEVVDRMVKAGMLEEFSSLWCYVVDQVNEEHMRSLFMTLKSDEARLAWLSYKFRKMEGMPV